MTKLGSVQRAFVPVRDIGENYLVLALPHAQRQRELLGVLEVSGLNYPLKSGAEQRLINDMFQVLLASLTYPLQIIMRVLPFDLERYLAPFDHIGIEAGHWQNLAASYGQFLRRMAKRRTLMERRFYVIVPASQTVREEQADLFHRLFTTRAHREEIHTQWAQAQHQLELRCTELTRQLGAMGLSVRRLSQRELLDLEYSCLSPQRADRYPLHNSWIEACSAVSSLDGQTAAQATKREKSDEPERGPNSHMKKRKAKKSADRAPAPRWPELADLLAPAGLHLRPDALLVESEWVQVHEVVALPRVVTAGWFNRLASIDVPMDISIYYTPLPTARTMRELQRARFVVSTTNVLDSERGRRDSASMVVQSDVEGLMDRIASGEDRLLEFAMRFMVRGDRSEVMQDRACRVQSTLQSMLLRSRPCWFEQDKAFRSCLPYARNELRADHAPIALASHEASATFPFLSHSLTNRHGILEGITQTGEPVIMDWWSAEQRNANRLIVAPSGAGKSFKAKIDIIRAHLWYNRPEQKRQNGLSYQTMIVDIEREYLRLTNLLDGECLRFASGTEHTINPFDLPQPSDRLNGEIDTYARGCTLAEKITQLQALLDIMLAPSEERRLSPSEKGLLDRALYQCYLEKGITEDPATHHRIPPLLSDLHQLLESECCGRDPTGLADRLQRFVYGSLASVFAGQTTVSLEKTPVVCFDIHDLSPELRPIILFLISTYVWNVSFASLIPRQFVVDELLTLYHYEEGKRFLETLFQRARKHYLSVCGITQYPKVLLDSTIPGNCATNIVMAQELASLPLVQEVFQLSETEVQLVRTFGKGEALLLANDKRFAVRFEASELEYSYCTSDPADLARFQHEKSPDITPQNTQVEIPVLPSSPNGMSGGN